MIFIYTLSCPVSGFVRYVGKTKDPKERYRKHISENNKTFKCQWVKSLKAKGGLPILEIIDECNSDDWQRKERFYIKLYRAMGAKLTNILDGGEGGPTMRGRKLTEQQVLKLIAAKKGKPNPKTAITNKLHKSIAVNMLSMEGHFIKRFQSITEAAKFINRDPRRIQKMINGGKVNHVGGYKFLSANGIDS